MFVCFWHNNSQWAMASSFTRFLNHIQQCSRVGRTPLDEWPSRRTDLYLTTHNTHNRRTSMPPLEFEPIMSGGERLQTDALDRTATGTCLGLNAVNYIYKIMTDTKFHSSIRWFIPVVWNYVLCTIMYYCSFHRPARKIVMYVGKSISELQIQVATHVFELSAGNCHH